MRDFLDQLRMRFLEWMSAGYWLRLDSQKCLSFGGFAAWEASGPNGKATVGVRLCTKNRWHTDSHAYEVETHTLYGRTDG